MKDGRRFLFSLCALAALLAAVYYTFAFTLSDPGHTLAGIGGDAAKNYFTYLYHIHFGKGLWFTGMNYPYGEHLTYADAQPLLSVPLSYLHRIFPFPPQVSLLLLHLLIPASFVIACVYIWKILTHFRVPAFPAALFAAAILFLSPQLARASGHFGLSYACYLPVVFYWTILYHETGKIRYIVRFAILTVIMTFLHPYFAATGCLWAGFYSLAVLLVRRKTWRAAMLHILPFIAAAALVAVTVQLYVKLTDPVTDRPVYPYDILNSFVTGDQIFSSSTSPFWQFFREAGIYPTEEYNAEKNTYPGIPVLVIVLVSFTGYLLRLRKKKQPAAPAHFDPVWVVMAVSVLLFTLGVPILWGGQWLVNYLSLLRQFRSVGRFVWIFYYIITVYAAVIFYRWYELKKSTLPIAAHGVMAAVLLLWGLDSVACINRYRKDTAGARNNYNIYFSTEEERWEQFLAAHGQKKESFQALLLLPFVHIGSEKLWLGGDHTWLMTLGTKAALQLHLPVVDVMLSRTSWSQTWSQVRTAAGPYAQKPLLLHADERPYLLLEYLEAPLSPDEQYLVDRAELIGARDQCRVYALYPSRVRSADQAARMQAAHLAAQLAPGTDTVLGMRDAVYIDHLDAHRYNEAFFGEGCAPPVTDRYAAIAAMDLIPQADSVLYEFSAWVLADRKDYRSPRFDIDLTDSAGSLLSRHRIETNRSVDNAGMWLRAAGYFRVPASCRKIICNLHNPHAGKNYLALDELMIRPAAAMVIARDKSGRVMVNNHLLSAGAPAN